MARAHLLVFVIGQSRRGGGDWYWWSVYILLLLVVVVPWHGHLFLVVVLVIVVNGVDNVVVDNVVGVVILRLTCLGRIAHRQTGLVLHIFKSAPTDSVGR